MFFFSGGSGSGEWRFHIHMSIAYWDLNNSKSGLAKKGQSISAAFQLILKAESVQESSQSKGGTDSDLHVSSRDKPFVSWF